MGGETSGKCRIWGEWIRGCRRDPWRGVVFSLAPLSTSHIRYAQPVRPSVCLSVYPRIDLPLGFDLLSSPSKCFISVRRSHSDNSSFTCICVEVSGRLIGVDNNISFITKIQFIQWSILCDLEDNFENTLQYHNIRGKWEKYKQMFLQNTT